MAGLEKAGMQQETDIMKMRANKELEGTKLGIKIAEKNIEQSLKDNELTKKEAIEGVKIGVDIAKSIHKQTNS